MPDIHPDDKHSLHSDAEGPSKSELKRQMTELQKLGEQLLHLQHRELEKMQLPQSLMEAVLLARRIKSREGKRRQLQYIGKLMRTIDAEPIRLQLLQREQGRQQINRQFHQLELLRDQLLSNGVSEIDSVIAHYPMADRTRLGQLVRAASKEQDQLQAPKSSRKLFRYLRELAEHSDQGLEDPAAE
jgi:ribosome-associated protein